MTGTFRLLRNEEIQFEYPSNCKVASRRREVFLKGPRGLMCVACFFAVEDAEHLLQDLRDRVRRCAVRHPAAPPNSTKTDRVLHHGPVAIDGHEGYELQFQIADCATGKIVMESWRVRTEKGLDFSVQVNGPLDMNAWRHCIQSIRLGPFPDADEDASEPPPVVMVDPVFGPLTLGAPLEGELELPPLGRITVEIETDNEPDPPSDAQQRAFAAFKADAPSIVPALLDAIARDARRRRMLKRMSVWEPEMSATELDQMCPDVVNPADIVPFVRDLRLVVPRQRGKAKRLHLDFECTWDEEHGRRATLRDGKVTRVGMPT